MTGNPWPYDMVISVDAHPGHLVMLLFVRVAWRLAPDADIPDLDPVPDVGTSEVPTTASRPVWEQRWGRAWERAWAWYPIEDARNQPRPTPELLARLSQPGQGLHPVIPPHWLVEHGTDGLDMAAHRRWSQGLVPGTLGPLDEQPERVCLPALIDAWHGGLDTIVTLPYAGYYAQRITTRHLVVSATTRNDPASYASALATRG
jgi:hypothetical protein